MRYLRLLSLRLLAQAATAPLQGESLTRNIKSRIAGFLIERLTWWAVGKSYKHLVGLENILASVRELRLKRESER